MYPQDARLRNFTYASNMTVDLNLEFRIRDGESIDEPVRVLQKTLPRINLSKMPIMLKSCLCVLNQAPSPRPLPSQSGECEFDGGGYFIINGSEKTIIAQDRPTENKINCFEGKQTPKWAKTIEIKCMPLNKCVSPKQVEMMIAAKNSNGFGLAIYIEIQRVYAPLELFAVFRALGVESDKEICDLIAFDVTPPSRREEVVLFLRASIVDANKHMNQHDALKHIGTHVRMAHTSHHYHRVQQKQHQYKYKSQSQSQPQQPQPQQPQQQQEKHIGEHGGGELGGVGVGGASNNNNNNNRKIKFVAELLQSELFPHCANNIERIYFLAYMARKLIYYYKGWLPADDRDSYINKRIDLAGALLNNLFRFFLSKLVKEMQKQIVREINSHTCNSDKDYLNIINMVNVYKILKPTIIENGIRRALATGDFAVKQTNSSTKDGVAQVLSRLNYQSALSHLRRINTPLDKNGELINPRKLHCTTWGYLCPPETPEGASIGVVKNLSYMTHITIAASPLPVLALLKSCEYMLAFCQIGSENAAAAAAENNNNFNYTNNVFASLLATGNSFVKIFINGAWVGVVNPQKNAYEVYLELKRHKHSGLLNIYTQIIFDFTALEIRICTECGRMTRPLIRLPATTTTAETTTTKNWNEMVESCLEYIDCEEQNHILIALNDEDIAQNPQNKYTHREIHPSTIMGVLASCIPFPNHNQVSTVIVLCLRSAVTYVLFINFICLQLSLPATHTRPPWENKQLAFMSPTLRHVLIKHPTI